jgi:hypothetical protein
MRRRMAPLLSTDPWPDLPLDAWRPTRDALHLWTQLVGKTLLAACPAENHWWHTALRVSARGLAGRPALDGDRLFDLELDLHEHLLVVRTSDGHADALPLGPGTIRDFHARYLRVLDGLGIRLHLWTTPVEIPGAVPFDRDEVHRAYDPAAARRFWEVLRRCEAVLKQFGTAYVGKQSPVHLFWGSFDLAATRFSGRRAPERPGADPVTREAYSHEVISFGFWPGGLLPSGATVDEPIFYAYQAPEADGLREAEVEPAGARYDAALGEFVLPYARALESGDPAAALRTFCESVYEAGAELGGWDRASLERPAAALAPSGRPADLDAAPGP